MPTPTSDSQSSHASLVNDSRSSLLAQFVLGVGLAVVVWFFGLIVWRLLHLPPSVQPATKPEAARLHLEATKPSEFVAQADRPLLVQGEGPKRDGLDRKEPIFDTFSLFQAGRAADRDFEQRLQASEAELRTELSRVPEVQLMSDDEVQNIRKEEQAAEKRISQPSPSAPIMDAPSKQYTVREVIRLNHLRNCLLCHAPSANKEDGLVRGVVPSLGQSLPNVYYESSADIDFVRADITFLRQDFSINLPVKDAAPWPKEQRYDDFVVRTRFATPEELTAFAAQPSNYPQRDAVLYALRGITAKNAGSSAAHWREILGIAVQAADKTEGAMLDAADKQTKVAIESLEKDISSKEHKHPKR